MNKVQSIILVVFVFLLGMVLGINLSNKHWNNRLEAYKNVCAPNYYNELYKVFDCDKSYFDAKRVENGWQKSGAE